MKYGTKFLMLLGGLLLGQFTQAQEVLESPKPKFEAKQQDQLIFDLTWENFTNKPDDLSYRWYNNGFNMAFMYDVPFSPTSHVSVAIGLGFSTQSYYSRYNIVSDSVGDGGTYSNWERVQDTAIKNNKFSTSYIELPVELRYRSTPNSKGFSWKFAVGAKVGYQFDAHSKTTRINPFNGEKEKYKAYVFPDVQEWRYGLYVRAGYGKVNFTCFYSMSPFFIENQGPEMNQLSVGISLLPF
jgi:hypothetical protein